MRYWQRRFRKIVKEKVLANWRYKLAALAAAFIVWSYVAGQQSMQAVFKVPVYFQNLPSELEMNKQKLYMIQVTVSGYRDRILSVKERQIWVSIDLSGMKPGRNFYKIKRDDVVGPAGIEVKSYTPKVIRITLKKVVKEVPEKKVTNENKENSKKNETKKKKD